MRIGIDFDNTIVCYDRLFHRLALERGLIEESFPARKNALRNRLRQDGKERLWTELQGVAYGPRITEATPFPGVIPFLRECCRCGINTAIVSHKTQHPFVGPQCDLRAAARNWMQHHGILEAGNATGENLSVFFESTKEEKLRRIAERRCTLFIDDLPEFLTESGFPSGVRRLLFDPHDEHKTDPAYERMTGWAEIECWLDTVSPES